MSTINNNNLEHNKNNHDDQINERLIDSKNSMVNPALFADLSFEDLINQAEDILNSDPSYAFRLTEYAETIAEQFGDKENIAKAKSLKGASLYKNNKTKEALEELSAALTLAKTPLLTCEISNRMAYCHYVLAQYKMTILLSQEALKIAQKFDSPKGHKQQVFSYNCIGLAYHNLSVFDAATTAFLKGLEIVHDSDPRRGHLNANLSLVQQSLGNFEKAFKYAEKALEVAVNLDDKIAQAGILGNFTHLHLDKLQYKEAIDFAQQALQIEQIPLTHKLSQYCYLAHAYCALGKFLDAQIQITNAKTVLEIFNHDKTKCEVLHCEAQIHLKQENYIKAKKVLNLTLQLADQTKQLEELYKIHLNLSKVYEKLGDDKKALIHHRAFHNIKTKVFNDQAEKRVQGLMIQHEVEELIKEKEITAEENLRLEKLVHQRTIEIEEAHMEMLERLAIAGEKRDDDTGEHTARVGRVCGLIAKEMGCDDIYVDTIKIAARLHDIGKIGVPDSILLKPQKLTDSEFEVVKTHAAIGAEMLTNSKSKLFQMAEKIAGTHHEKWNGKGYPNGLVGEEIPLEGRIVAVADVYDALTNDRPYKDTWTHEAALEELFRSADSHLDRKVVEAFHKLFEKGIVSSEDLREKPKKKAKISDAYDQEIFADDS